MIDQVIDGGGATWSEDQLIPIYRNGKIEDVYWTFSYSPVKDDSGKVAGVLITCHETTNKVNILNELRESNEQLAFTIDAAKLGTFDFNPITNNFTANRRLKEWFGFALDQDISFQDVIERVRETDKERVQQSINQSLKFDSGGDFDMQITIIQPFTNNEIVLQARGIVAFDENNIAHRLHGTLQEITEQRRSQEQLEWLVQDRTQALAQNIIDLDKVNKELQSFAYISSHDLQEPLRKIQTFVTLILEKDYDNLSELGKNYFDRMKNAAERMQTLINDLLSYSRTHNVEKDFKEELLLKNATVIKTTLCETNIISFQFRQLFSNLISNSIKFAQTGVALRITINSEILDGELIDLEGVNKNISYCHVQYADNGIGFESQYNVKVFDLFKRLHGKSEYQGTGIGLDIVKKIIENHNGFITAKGVESEGVTFDIYIPHQNN